MPTDALDALAFRPVLAFPGYFAGSDGHVYSTKASPGDPRRLRARANCRTGHLRIRLYGGTATSRAHNGRRARFVDVYAHVVVCEAWYGPPPFEGAMVLHADDVPTRNNPGNLRWGSAHENAADRRDNEAAADEAEAQHREGMRLRDGPGAAMDARWGF